MGEAWTCPRCAQQNAHWALECGRCHWLKRGAVDRRLVALLYVLMRDHVQPGVVRRLVDELSPHPDFTFSAPEMEQLARRYLADLLQ